MVKDLLMLIDSIRRVEGTDAEVLMKNAKETEKGKDVLALIMFAEMDTNQNGFIEWQELVDYMVGLSRLTGKPPPDLETLKAIFVKADLNKDKKLSFEEIRTVLHGLIEVSSKARTIKTIDLLLLRNKSQLSKSINYPGVAEHITTLAEKIFLNFAGCDHKYYCMKELTHLLSDFTK